MNAAQGLLSPQESPAAAWSAVAGRLGESTMGDVLRWGAGGSINFAGGFPDERLFPMWHVREAMEGVLARRGPQALQYGSAQGAEWVREAVAGHLERRGVRTSPGTMLLTSGGQQAIDLVTRLYVDPGDVVVTTTPTYFAALELFEAAGAEVVTVPSPSRAWTSTGWPPRSATPGPRSATSSPTTRTRPASACRPSSARSSPTCCGVTRATSSRTTSSGTSPSNRPRPRSSGGRPTASPT